jgi:outer membrane protein
MTNRLIAGMALLSWLFIFNDSKPSLAAEKQTSLADCIATTVQENRTIKNAYLDRIVQKYDLRVAEDKFTPKLLLTPQVSSNGSTAALGSTGTTAGKTTTTISDASGTVTELLPTGAAINLAANYDLTSTDTAKPGRSYGWNINLTQPLLKGGGLDVNLASVRTARLNEQGNILSLKDTLMNTLTSVVKAYRTYVQAIKSLEISRQSLERSRELITTNRELIAAGRMAAIEIVQSEADLANKEFSQLSAENAVDAARLALTKAIDIDKNSRINPVTEAKISDVPYSFAQASKLAFENRPDYQRALLGYEAAKIQLVTAKNSTLWDLSLTGSYAENYTRNNALGSDSSIGNWTAGLKLTVPIGDLSIQQAYIAADIGLKKMVNDLAKQRESIEIEVQDALRTAEMNHRQIKLAILSRTLSEKKVEIETEKLKAGRSTNFQLVSYQNDLVNAQNGELGAVINYLNALTDLDKTVGVTLEKWGVSLIER